MPGRQVKNWPKYHRLRRKGLSKQSAARIANAGSRRRAGRRKLKRRGR